MAKSPTDERQLHGGINQDRKCRDFIFIIIFAIFWAGMFVVCSTAVSNGAPYTLVVPQDYLGNYCGIKNSGNNSYSDRTDYPNLYYINPFNLNGTNASYICVKSCPSTTQVVNFANYSTSSACRYNVILDTPTDLATNVAYDTCAPYVYASTPILQRCVPSQAIDPSFYNTTISAGNTSVSVANMVHSGIENSQIAIADVYTTWPLLLVCCFTAIAISIFWLFIAQFFVGIFVWGSMILINIVAIAATIILYFFYDSRNTAFKNGSTASGAISINAFGVSVNENIGFLNTSTVITQTDVNVALGVFIGVLIATIIIFLVSIFMIKRVKIAIEVVHEASCAFRSLPGIQFVPLLYSILEAVLFCYFVIIGLYIMSPTSSNISISLLNVTITSGKNTSYYMMWYHIAGFLWAFFTLIGLSQLTVAGAVAEWYWTADKSKKLGSMPVARSAWRAVRYHLGSVIIGALLITIVELIRLFLYQLQKQIATSTNPYLKYLVACAQCCMKCIEVIVKWINRQAYVYIAITGKAFFAAAGAATALLVRNAAKTFAVNFVADVVLLFTKVFVVGINAIGAYAFLIYNPKHFQNGVFDPTIPVVFVIVETFAIASCFFSNYQLAIDTIFLSVLEDMDKNDGSAARPYFMTDKMMKIMSTHNEKDKGKVKDQHLNLIKHPEGGYFREIFRSGATSMASKGATDRNGTLVSSDRQAFPEDDGKRNDLTSIYWMAVKENLLLLCRNESDHIHYFLKGAPFQYWITNPKTGETETLILGPDLANGHVLQIPVKGGYWKCGRLLDDDEFDFALIAEAVGPGFDFRDFRLISKDEFSYLTTSDSRDRDNLALFLQKEEDAKGYQGNGFHDGIYS